jgi:hypothetical protein
MTLKSFLSLIHKNILLTFFALGFFVYGNGLINGFVLDDRNQILNNSLVHSIPNIPQLFTGGTFGDGGFSLYGNYYRPLMTTVYTLIYSLLGPNPIPFHFFQLILFIVNAWIVYKLLSRFLNLNLALFGSLVFLLHPINSETVLYISSFQDTLFLFFGLSALLIFMSEKIKNYKLLLTFSLLFLSLLSKETGVLFILMLLIYQWFYEKKYFLKSFVLSFSIGLIYLFLKYFVAHISLSVDRFAPITRLPIFERLLQIPMIILYYLKTFFYPATLVAVQNWIIHSATALTFYLPLLLCFIILMLIVAVPLILFKKDRIKIKTFFFFAAWFALGLLVHLQIQPLDSTVADHWFYFPIIGLLGMLLILTSEIKFEKKISLNIIFFLCLILLLSLSLRSFVRTFDWRNETTLSTHDLQSYPNNFVLQNTLGTNLLDKNDLPNAEIHFKKALIIDPGNNMAWNNLGFLYEKLGMKNKNPKLYQMADGYYQKSIAISPNQTAYVNLAEVKLFKEQVDLRSTNDFIKTSLIKYPNNPNLLFMHAITLYILKDKQNALIELSKALQIEPQNKNYLQTYNWITTDTPINLTP